MENKYSEVTMNEFVESTQAKKLFNNALEDTKWYVLGPSIALFIGIIITFFGFIIGSVSTLNTIPVVIAGGIVILISAIFWYLGKNIREAKVSKYREIFKRAKKNDEIRYDEKIRFLERKRLESEYNNQNTAENIEKTLKGPEPLDTTEAVAKKTKK